MCIPCCWVSFISSSTEVSGLTVRVEKLARGPRLVNAKQQERNYAMEFWRVKKNRTSVQGLDAKVCREQQPSCDSDEKNGQALSLAGEWSKGTLVSCTRRARQWRPRR